MPLLYTALSRVRERAHIRVSSNDWGRLVDLAHSPAVVEYLVGIGTDRGGTYSLARVTEFHRQGGLVAAAGDAPTVRRTRRATGAREVLGAARPTSGAPRSASTRREGSAPDRGRGRGGRGRGGRARGRGAGDSNRGGGTPSGTLRDVRPGVGPQGAQDAGPASTRGSSLRGSGGRGRGAQTGRGRGAQTAPGAGAGRSNRGGGTLRAGPRDARLGVGPQGAPPLAAYPHSLAAQRTAVQVAAAGHGVPPLPAPHAAPLWPDLTLSRVFMPLVAAAIDCVYLGHGGHGGRGASASAGLDALKAAMGAAYFEWLTKLYREDFRARGVRAALEQQGYVQADGTLCYLTASLQEALLLTAIALPANELDWRTNSSDGRTPEHALSLLVGVPPSHLPPYVFGTLSAWARSVNTASPAWFATSWLLASDLEFPPEMRAWWPGFMAVV